jgi:tetratricopeptide (TPR) repeat protein
MDPQVAEWELVRDYAELALTTGDADRALVLTGDLLETPGLAAETELAWSVRRIRAHALEATVDFDGAIEELERLAAETPRDVEWIRLMIALARCYRDSDALDRAIGVLLRAEPTIAELGPAGAEEAIRLRLTIVDAYARRGDATYALYLCRRAIEDAEAIGSSVARASAYWNTSVYESNHGRGERALSLAQQAMTVFEAGEDFRNAARLRLAMGEIELCLATLGAEVPLATLRRAEQEMELTSASRAERARSLRAQAEAHYRLGDLDSAERDLDRAEALATGGSHNVVQAGLLRGRVALARGDRDAAARLYAEAGERTRTAPGSRDRAELWVQVASALSEIGDTEAAMAAYRSAAECAGLGSYARAAG